MKLENWSFGTKVTSPYQPPEMGIPILSGDVYGHPKHHDGKNITTSMVVGQRNGRVVTRSGSEYELLTVDPVYESQYPNARERLFKTLPTMDVTVDDIVVS